MEKSKAGLMKEGKRGPAFYDWWDRIDLCKNVSEDKSKEPIFKSNARVTFEKNNSHYYFTR